MRKTLVKIVCIVFMILFIVSTSACGIFTVNEDRDNASVVATIDGRDITKAEFKAYLKFTNMLYDLNGYIIPTEEDETYEEYIGNIFNDYITNLLYSHEAEALEISGDAEGVQDSVDELMTNMKAAYPNEADYEAFLASYDTTEEEFIANATTQLTMLQLADLFTQYEGYDYTAVTMKTAVTVDGVELPNYLLYYYVVISELYTYAYEGTYPQSQEEVLSVFDSSLVDLENDQTLIAYGEAQGYELTQEEIDTALMGVDMLIAYFGDESVSLLLKNYYMTEDQRAEARLFMGKAAALKQKITDDTIATIEPTEKELEDYYDDNIDSYDPSTASVYHILTADKTVAQMLEDEAGGTGEGFMQVYDKYKDNETIIEASEYKDITRATNFVPEFLEAVFNAKEGDVIGMVETTYGYHLIYVYEKNDVEVPAFEDIKDTVKTDYIASVQTDKVNEALEKIYDAKIKEGDYRKLTETVLVESLEEKYDVTKNTKIALR